MLHLYQSNRLEILTETAVALMQHAPLQGAFAPEEIVVQSQGMRRYLNHYLAERSGIAANLRFSLPAALSWRLTRTFLPDTPALNPFAPEVMRWRLLRLLQGDHLPPAVHAALAGYLNSNRTAPYRLAGKLADVFDQYLVYRPDWVAAWENGESMGLGADEIWQAELWHLLAADGTDGGHRAEQRRRLLAALSSDKLPERYLVFGIATLAPMYLDLLQRLAEHTEVHIFAVNPSSRYWGDIESARRQALSGLPDAEAAGHPLLASLGKQGRDFFDMLTAEGRVDEQHDWFPAPPAAPSLLQRVQQDIQTLSLPERGSAAMDGSITIQSAHSRLRELQILKDWLLGVLAEDADLQPHHIAVLTPDIESYAPYIHAVFGEEQPGSPTLPYSVADVKISRRPALMQLAEQLLALMQSRFETDYVLPLLDSPAVCRRWHFSEHDADHLRHSIAELNIRWGSDADMRRRYGGSGEAFTWQQGSERTALGWLMPENSGLWQGVLPWTADWSHTAVQARWQQLLACLRRHHALWQTDAAPAEWCARLHALLDDLAGSEPADADDQAARQQLHNDLAAWQAESALAGYLKPLPPETACEHLARFFTGSGEAGFLRGGITFCGMVPMRSLPFDTLCLLGLNDGRFPRQTQIPAFDLISRHPRKGDRARRDDDRYLFLESLLSARRRLYLSYIGRDSRKDEALAPSPLLSELADVLALMGGQSSAEFAEQHIRQHPLQPFSPRYFSGSPSSSRQDYAEALNRLPQPPAPFAGDCPPAADCPDPIPLEHLLRFWRNPVRHWLARALQWREPYADEAAESAEPYAIEASNEVARQYLDARRRHQDFADTEAKLAAQSLVPAGLLGHLLQAPDIRAVKRLNGELLHSPRLPAQAFELACGGRRLTGSLSQLYEHGQILYRSGAPTAPDTVELWLLHVVYCAAGSGSQPRDTHWLSAAAPHALPPIEREQAQAWLASWLDYYALGHSRPLPFFAKTSLAAARAYTEDSDTPPDAAVKAARGDYRSGRFSAGQAERTEVAQVFGRDEAEPIETPLFWNLVRELLVPLHLYFAAAEAT